MYDILGAFVFFLVHISALFLIHNKCSFTFALVDILATITDGPARLGAMKASQLLAAMLTTDLRLLVYLLLMLFYFFAKALDVHYWQGFPMLCHFIMPLTTFLDYRDSLLNCVLPVR